MKLKMKMMRGKTSTLVETISNMRLIHMESKKTSKGLITPKYAMALP